jgi:four helix bundle protein
MEGKHTKTHKDLEIWKEGIKLVTKIYKLTKNFPKEELYGLTSQMRRAAVSYPSNISEGAARESITEYIRYIYISLGSLSELETQLIISRNLRFLSNIDDLLSDIKALNSRTRKLVRYLKKKKTS